MEKFLKKAGWTSIITSLVLAIIGMVMIYNPQTTMQFISTVLGVFFIVIGVIKLINYFVAKGNSSIFSNDIALGIISILIGLVVIVYSSTIENLFRIMIGIWIIYSGFTRLTLSFKLKNVNERIWAFVLILSILMVIGGNLCNILSRRINDYSWYYIANLCSNGFNRKLYIHEKH